MINRRKLVALVLTLASVLTMATGCPAKESKGRHQPPTAGRHRQVPAPIPDTPAVKTSTFPGNVSVTLWWEQAQGRTVVLFDVGKGKNHRTGKRPAGHWEETTKPGAHIYAIIVPANPGEHGRIYMYVTNNANGTKICEDDNSDTQGAGGAECAGVVNI
jgi:hypothetical protein